VQFYSRSALVGILPPFIFSISFFDTDIRVVGLIHWPKYDLMAGFVGLDSILVDHNLTKDQADFIWLPKGMCPFNWDNPNDP
jgi:hypothetical protein